MELTEVVEDDLEDMLNTLLGLLNSEIEKDIILDDVFGR